MTTRLARPVKRLLLTMTAGWLAACASGGPREDAYRTGILLEPPRVGAGATVRADSALPPLPLTQIAAVDPGAQRITLDAAGTDLRRVLQQVAQAFGLGYDIDNAVEGRVHQSLRNVTLEQALDALATRSGYEFQIQDNVLRVGPARFETRIFALDYVSMTRIGTATTVVQRQFGSTVAGADAGVDVGGGIGGLGAGGDVIRSVTVADLWAEIRITLEGLVFDTIQTPAGLPTTDATTPAAAGAFSRTSGGRTLSISPMSGTIVVTAPAPVLQRVAAYLATFEASVHRQVLIEAKIVEVILTRETQYGIDWSSLGRVGQAQFRIGGTPTPTQGGGVQITLDAGPGQVTALLNALNAQGEVRVLSSPRTSALNNQRATFSVTTDRTFFSVTRQPIRNQLTGEVISFETEIDQQLVSVGIVLDVLPQVSADNTVTMNIRPQVTDVVAIDSLRLSDGTSSSVPVVDRRQTDTMARVRSGETIVIGGLMQTRDIQSTTGVPILRDVPLLGRLFRNTRVEKEKRELVIFVTPTVVAGQPRPGGP